MDSMSSNKQKEHDLQKDRLYVRGFGADQEFQEIRDFCLEYGKEHILYMKRCKQWAVFVTYKNDETAEKAMHNFKLNHVAVNYARWNPIHLARMHSNGIKVNAMPETKPEKKDHARFKAGCLIRIIKTTDSDKIFVLMKNDSEHHKQFMDDVNEMASEMKPLNGMPKEEEVVVTSYKGKFFRAMVLAEVPDKPEIVEIHMPDIAKKIRTHYTELKNMPQSFKSTQGFGPKVQFVHTFHLAHVAALEKNSYATKILQFFVDTEWNMSSAAGSYLKPYAEIVLTNPNNIVKNLNTFIKMLSGDTLAMDSLVKKENTWVGPNKTLVVIDDSNLKDNDNLITFVERNSLELFVRNQDLVQRFGHVVDAMPAYSPKPDEVCIGKVFISFI